MAHTPTSDISLKRAWQVSLGVMGLLLLGSIVWYRQRILFLDPSMISFDVINKQQPNIPEHRYGAIASQAWPLVGAYLHLPLKALLILYSASFYIFYFAVMLVLGRMRQYALGILMAFYFTLLVSDVYFWPNNEVHQGIGWMMLFLGMLFRFSDRGVAPIWTHSLMLGCLFMAVFSHFIVIVPFTFLWLYWMLYSPQYWDTRAKKIQLACYAFAMAAIFLIKLKMGSGSGYDSAKLGPVLNVKPKEIIESFYSGSACSMYKLILLNYWIIIPIIIVGVMALRLTAQRWRFWLTVAYGLGFFSLVCLTYRDAYDRHLLFYMESEWMAWAIILATPAVLHVLPGFRPKVAVLAMLLIFAIRVAYIGNSFRLFDARYRTVDAIVTSLHEQHITKAVLVGTPGERDPVFIMDWASPYESLLLSGLKGYNPQVTYRMVDSSYRLPDNSAPLFISPFAEDPVQRLNARYFRVDSTQAYQSLPLKAVLH